MEPNQCGVLGTGHASTGCLPNLLHQERDTFKQTLTSLQDLHASSQAQSSGLVSDLRTERDSFQRQLEQLVLRHEQVTADLALANQNFHGVRTQLADAVSARDTALSDCTVLQQVSETSRRELRSAKEQLAEAARMRADISEKLSSLSRLCEAAQADATQARSEREAT